jgi:trehalose 6-phosphate phosphatase
VHYRHAPEAEGDLRAALEAIALGDQWQLLSGHRVFEIKARGWNKGTAIRRIMENPPFAGRRPIVIGDDRTDLDGIAAAHEMGGVGIAVGNLEADVSWRLADPAAVRAWLSRLSA